MDIFTNNTGLLLLLVIWVIPWKIYALWTAAKLRHKGWFAALVILNTFAILDIFYIFYIAKKSWNQVKGAFFGVMQGRKKS